LLAALPLLSVTALLGLSGRAHAVFEPQQTLPLKVDCGDLNGYPAPEPGWTLMSETAQPAGVSLSPPALDTVHVAGLGSDGSTPVPADVWAVDPDELSQRHRLTSLKLADPSTLTITGLPASQPLRVRLELGALAPWAEIDQTHWTLMPATPSTAVLVEEQKTSSPVTWRPLARDVRCSTGYLSNSFTSVLGGVVSVWVLAHSDATGKLVLRLSSAASTGADPLYLAGFELHKHEALPVVYHKSGTLGPLVAQQSALNAFAAAFNQHDYAAAELAAKALSDPFQRGVARCWLIGWLDGSRDGRFHLMAQARGDLVAGATGHAAVPWLLSQLDELQRALDHLDARGYDWARECASEGGYGFLNKECAGQVDVLGQQGHSLLNVNGHAALRRLAGLCTPAAGATIRTDIDAWNAAPLGYGGWEPSPFLFAAAKQYAATIIGINPLLSVNATDPASAPFVAAFKNTFQMVLTGGGFETSHFPRDVELPLFKAYAAQGSHPMNWTDATVAATLTEAQIEASWWGPLVEDVPVDSSLPPWASKQRTALGAYRSAVDYWLQERLIRGELGGGNGDDVELLLQLYPLYAMRQDPGDGRNLAAIDALVRFVLEESGDVVNGYFAGGMTDVEHSGEYTSNTAAALRGAVGFTARAIETGLGVAGHLKSASAPAAAWTGLTPLGRLHFKSYMFTTTGPDPAAAQAFDVPLNGRAMFPSVAVLSRGALGSTHPLLTDLSAWARAWRDDALETTGGKPRGFFGPVGYPANQFGGAGKWWTLGTSSSDTDVWGGGESSYVLELLRVAYLQSTAADRWRYLLPAVRVLRAVKDWEDAGKPSGSAGSAHWAAAQLFASPRFQALLVSCTGLLEDDPVLTTTDDPDLSGSAPYVDSALIARMHAWVETTSLPALNLALRYALLPVAACDGAGSTAKPPSLIEFNYDRAIPFWRAMFPLLTKHVLHTDRVFLNRYGILGHMTAAHGGSGLTEGLLFRPAARWIASQGSLDTLAVSCNLLAYDGTAYGAFVHHPGPQPLAVELVLDEGLVPGRYQVELGAAQAKCDQFPGGNSAVIVQKRGTGARVPLLLEPGLQLVRVLRLGPPDLAAQRWDLALDPPRMSVSLPPVPQPATMSFDVRMVNAGAVGSAPATLRMYATLLKPLGEPASPSLTKLLFYTGPVPALAGSSGFTLPSHNTQLPVPFGSISNYLLAGFGLEIRAELSAGDTEWDPLNNALSRRFYLSDLSAAAAD
jgi:hypothetical protein